MITENLIEEEARRLRLEALYFSQALGLRDHVATEVLEDIDKGREVAVRFVTQAMGLGEAVVGFMDGKLLFAYIASLPMKELR